MHDLCLSRDNRLQVDMLVLDFPKAFDTVPHHRLKLGYYGVSAGSTHTQQDFGVPPLHSYVPEHEQKLSWNVYY